MAAYAGAVGEKRAPEAFGDGHSAMDISDGHRRWPIVHRRGAMDIGDGPLSIAASTEMEKPGHRGERLLLRPDTTAMMVILPFSRREGELVEPSCSQDRPVGVTQWASLVGWG
jgi:hypothetical protein